MELLLSVEINISLGFKTFDLALRNKVEWLVNVNLILLLITR